MRLENQGEITGSSWLGLDWSDWTLLEPGTKKISQVPETSGFFRVKKVEGEELDYVGQTGRSLRERLVHLANRIDSEERPEDSLSAEHLWELSDFGGRFEFSYANPNIARSETDRLGLENVMFAVHMKHAGRSPTVNLDRRLKDEGDETVIDSLDWTSSPFTSRDWLGLDWTEPRELSRRTEIDESRVVYRIWFPGYTPPLAHIGKSTNVANRLIKHEKKFGPRAKFSVAPLDSRLEDVEAALIADHYIRTNTLPKGQDGRRNRFSWSRDG
ncbi:MAG: hypothetical protein ABEJ66_02755 [Candidatus Nanohaloarchaea archaeon]